MEIIKSEGDFVTSVEKALDEIDMKWREYPGLIVCGSHAPADVEKKIAAIREARKNGTPFLGICFGMQLAAIEYVRTESQLEEVSTEELSGKPDDLINKLPKLRVGMFQVDSWWATQGESHWHNYALNSTYKSHFEKEWDISWSDSIAEMMMLKGHPFFVGVQFHPEYQSSKDKRHPLLVKFLDACRK